jgi:hypothetical protein
MRTRLKLTIGAVAAGLTLTACGAVGGPASGTYQSMLGNVHPALRPDSGLAGCASLSGTHHLTATGYPKIRAEFAGSRWPGLRTAGTAYADLLTQLRHARGTDGYETAWFYQRLCAACARHGRALNVRT